MVLSEALLLLSLLSPCFSGTEVQNVDKTALALIISHIQTKYNPEHGHQFAVAINVPRHYCEENSRPDKNFLKNDDSSNVISAMNGVNRVYVGTSLIGATKKKEGNTMSHSEYLLLNPPNASPMKTLLKKNDKGCVIFYTYYSPCLGICLNPEKKKFNILEALKMFGTHKGPKAFVFNTSFGEEDKNTFEKGFRAINKHVPLYRCDNSGCISCLDDQNNIINDCLPLRP